MISLYSATMLSLLATLRAIFISKEIAANQQLCLSEDLRIWRIIKQDTRW